MFLVKIYIFCFKAWG